MAQQSTDRRFTIVREIAAPIEEVFHAWGDGELMSEWMTPDPARPSRVEVDFRVGGRFIIDMPSQSGNRPHVGEYLSLEPPHALSFTWRSVNTRDRDTVVSVKLRALAPDRTELTLEHQGFVEDAMMPMHRGGWTQLLGQLEASLRAGAART